MPFQPWKKINPRDRAWLCGNMLALGHSTARMARDRFSLSLAPAGRKRNHFKVPINCFCFPPSRQVGLRGRREVTDASAQFDLSSSPCRSQNNAVTQQNSRKPSLREPVPGSLSGLWQMDTFLTFRKLCFSPIKSACRVQTVLETKLF